MVPAYSGITITKPSKKPAKQNGNKKMIITNNGKILTNDYTDDILPLFVNSKMQPNCRF